MDNRPPLRQDQSLVQIVRKIRGAPATRPRRTHQIPPLRAPAQMRPNVPPPAQVPYFTPYPARYGSQHQAAAKSAGFWWVWSAGSILPFLGSLILIETGNINLFTVVLLLVGIANIVLALFTEGYTSGGTGVAFAQTFALITGWLGVIGFGLLCCLVAAYVLLFLAHSP